MRLRVLIRACRPRQWVKNILVLTAPTAAGVVFQPRAALGMVVAVIAFCLVASSGIYLVNDVVDVESDRAHATKRRRPVASSELSVRAAWTAAVVLLPGALVIAALLTWQLLVVIAIYEGVQLWYCLGMKHEPVIELTSVASGFLLRAIAGAWRPTLSCRSGSSSPPASGRCSWPPASGTPRCVWSRTPGRPSVRC